MKKRITGVAALALSALIGGSVMTSACSFLGCESDLTGQYFTVTYNDYDGKHTAEVRHGFTFEIAVPERTGYKFLGFYDAETDGNQVTDADGASLEKCTYREDVTLYPRWQANEYTVVLNYGEGSGSVKSVKATYDQSLPELPKTVEYAHHDFLGWYTAANCGGVQIADGNGLNPVVSIVNAQNFNVSGTTFTLYAGYAIKNYTVTLKFNNGSPDEMVTVPYGTSVKDIAYKTRGEDGKAVLTWADDTAEAFTGSISGDITLTAAAWAPCINFDTDGGAALAPVVAETNAKIELPTPVKDLNKFVGWEKDGAAYTDTTMPAQSITLKAKWQAKIVFDANGGGEVKDISKPAGESVSLPKPEKDGFIFAGWYDKNDERYTSATMPAAGIKLKAGWYKEKVGDRVSVTTPSGYITAANVCAPTTAHYWYKLGLAKYMGQASEITVRVDAQFRFSYNRLEDVTRVHTDIYSKNAVNSAYLLYTKDHGSVSSDYKTFNFSAVLTVKDDAYISFYVDSTKAYATYLKDFYYTVTYPDTTELYL